MHSLLPILGLLLLYTIAAQPTHSTCSLSIFHIVMASRFMKLEEEFEKVKEHEEAPPTCT